MNWRSIGLIAAALAVIVFHNWRVMQAADHAYRRGVDETTATYTAAALKASEDFRAREARAAAHNAEVIRGYRDELAAIALDRDAGARRLLDVQAALTRSRAAAETSGLAGAARAAYLAGRARELEEATGRYDAACRRDAAQLEALIGQVKPQL